ncbi:hypothetical protein F511_25470 [Dorcoceras hygrometricum]|uniref:DUF4408 domain-containing protein n=1 Tax=Dorcoceras hygrometricum TaxID=472368 RepID=A0A2Z7ARH1_9LAMI|nr:hypothetical protein F511_25470 [Dorcoceras hygrometricum]
MENSMKPKEKIEAMKKYKRARFLYNLFLYSLTTLITFLFVSYPFWLPSTKHFLLVSVPDYLSGFFDAKCFFVLGNMIVFILVGESRLATARSSNLSTASVDVYDEYVVRSKSFREIKPEITGDGQREGGFVKGLVHLEEKSIGTDKNKEEITRNQKVVTVRRMRKVEDLTSMPMDELNERVEAFIERVNRQRSLEY